MIRGANLSHTKLFLEKDGVPLLFDARLAVGCDV